MSEFVGDKNAIDKFINTIIQEKEQEKESSELYYIFKIAIRLYMLTGEIIIKNGDIIIVDKQQTGGSRVTINSNPKLFNQQLFIKLYYILPFLCVLYLFTQNILIPIAKPIVENETIEVEQLQNKMNDLFTRGNFLISNLNTIKEKLQIEDNEKLVTYTGGNEYGIISDIKMLTHMGTEVAQATTKISKTISEMTYTELFTRSVLIAGNVASSTQSATAIVNDITLTLTKVNDFKHRLGYYAFFFFVILKLFTIPTQKYFQIMDNHLNKVEKLTEITVDLKTELIELMNQENNSFHESDTFKNKLKTFENNFATFMEKYPNMNSIEIENALDKSHNQLAIENNISGGGKRYKRNKTNSKKKKKKSKTMKKKKKSKTIKKKYNKKKSKKNRKKTLKRKR